MAFKDNVSENIAYLAEHPEAFTAVRNKSYEVLIQQGDPAQTYNTGEPGQVYNKLEDVVENVKPGCVVITDLASGHNEAWCAKPTEQQLAKYGLTPAEFEAIPPEGKETQTQEVPAIMFAVQIAKGEEFVAKTSWAELNGNRAVNSRGDDVPHGEGDVLLIGAKEVDGKLVPDFDSEPRIINGTVFAIMYQQAEPERLIVKEAEQDKPKQAEKSNKSKDGMEL